MKPSFREAARGISLCLSKEKDPGTDTPGAAPSRLLCSDACGEGCVARTRVALAKLKQADRTGAVRRPALAAARFRRRTTSPDYGQKLGLSHFLG